MIPLTLSSGYASKIVSGTSTKGYRKLWQDFTADAGPEWNAFASPIDALRTGAILEERYLEYIGDQYYSQYKAVHPKFDVARASLDFSRFEGGKLVEFEELKTIWINEYIDTIRGVDSENAVSFIKKKFSSNYKQIQFQLSVTGLPKAKLVFLSVESYEDEVNWSRNIEDNDVTKIWLPRDEEMISKFEERFTPFQMVRDQILGRAV